MGLGLLRDTGLEKGPKEEARAVGGQAVPFRLGVDGLMCRPCDSWDSLGPYPG